MFPRRVLLCMLASLCVLAFGFVPSAVAEENKATITATAGQPFTGQVADISAQTLACPPGDLSNENATIVWGDDPSTAGVVATDKAGTGLSVSGTHTYLAVGPHEGSVTVGYECNAHKFSTKAAFTAQVKAQETPPTEPPVTTMTPTTPNAITPPPSTTSTQAPAVKAAFSEVSLTPGRAVLDASPSAPAGTSVARYSWSNGGAAQPDAVCQGTQPQLTVMTRAATDTTIALTAVDAQGAATSTQQTFDIPAPLARTAKSAHAAALGGQGAARTAARPLTAHRFGLKAGRRDADERRYLRV